MILKILLAATAFYHGDVSINPIRRELHASWKISFPIDSTTTDSVRVLLNRGLKVDKLSGPFIRTHRDSTAADRRVITLYFKSPRSAGEQTTFDISYSGKPVFGGDNINGINEHWIE